VDSSRDALAHRTLIDDGIPHAEKKEAASIETASR
jgi:hypothetical protein